jgi:hypothetical protein
LDGACAKRWGSTPRTPRCDDDPDPAGLGLAPAPEPGWPEPTVSHRGGPPAEPQQNWSRRGPARMNARRGSRSLAGAGCGPSPFGGRARREERPVRRNGEVSGASPPTVTVGCSRHPADPGERYGPAAARRGRRPVSEPSRCSMWADRGRRSGAEKPSRRSVTTRQGECFRSSYEDMRTVRPLPCAERAHLTPVGPGRCRPPAPRPPADERRRADGVGGTYSNSERTLTPLLVSTIGIGRSTPGGWFFRL